MTHEERAQFCIEQAEAIEAELPPRPEWPPHKTAAECMALVWRLMAARLREVE